MVVPAYTLDRRTHDRGCDGEEPSRERLVNMIVGTYREMPGLCLYVGQASLLFGLHAQTCQVVLDDLVKEGELRRLPGGKYLS
jgi:hypothetical protein